MKFKWTLPNSYSIRWLIKIDRCPYMSQYGIDAFRGMATTSSTHPAKKANQKQKFKSKAEKPVLRHLNYIAKKGGESNLIPPGCIDVIPLGTGAAGSTRSVFIDMTYFRYLFNCGEGTQRAAAEHKMRITKIKDVFITHNSWTNTGGLLGLGLSLGDMGVPSFKVHGPPNVEKMLTMSKGFSPLTLKIEKREISEGQYEDSAMTIDFIPIHPTFRETDGTEPAEKRCRRTNDDDMSVIYYCQPIRKPRSLDLNKAVELGVPRGPSLGKLKAGETVTLLDGQTIEPDQVLSEPEVIPPLLVLEVPTLDYMDSFVNNPMLKELQQKSGEDAPQIIVHLSPPEVMQCPEYHIWMDAFPVSTRHMVLNSDGSAVSQVAPYEVQARLNLIHPDIFPLLPQQDKEREHLPDIVSGQRIVPGQTCLRYSVREGSTVKRGFHVDNCLNLNNEAFISESKENKDFQAALLTTNEHLDLVCKQGLPGAEYPELLFLGTGSALPNKIRNVSAILLHRTASECMLLDAGEGTYGQLCRHYGSETQVILRRLDTVFISHLHADHHMGLIGVIEGRELAFKSANQVAPPLTVIVSKNYQKFVEATDRDILPLSEKIKLVPLEWFVHHRDQELNSDECQQVAHALGLIDLKFCWMLHAQFPFGIAMTHMDGWKLAYSGDTMPCDQFVNIGRNCDILIHEATMEDELQEDAAKKRHSTTSQAIEIGMKMNAKFILLTHFSQRYAKVPRMNPNFTDKVGIAFDNMRVRPRDLQLLPIILPALQTLFSDDLHDLDRRAEKRQLNKESKELLKEEAEEALAKSQKTDELSS